MTSTKKVETRLMTTESQRKFMELLRLPAHTQKFVFEWEINGIPKVTCEYTPLHLLKEEGI